jgi:hemoglobin
VWWAALIGVVLLLGLVSPLACAGASPHPVVVAEVPLDAGDTDADAAPAAPVPPPLYVRLGGKDGVSAIVDALVDDLFADKRLQRAFAKVKKNAAKREHFKQELEDQICEMTAGACQYHGKTMSDEHGAMRITAAQFDAFVGDLRLALEEKQVAIDDQQQLLDQFNMLKDQIVTSHP